MTFADLAPLANHLWQSTLFAAMAWVLTLALRRNRAAVRYWIWLAASVKFLIPFSLLVRAGAQLGWRTAPIVARAQLSYAIEEISQPFAVAAPMPLPTVPAPSLDPLPAIVLGVWLCGIVIGIVFWLRWWRLMRGVRRAATPLDLRLPIRAMSSPARMEPGVVGILRPFLFLPEGIADCLTPPQLEAILAHELRHVQRRDNLTAAIHMLVETIFWFHPLVWWIGARLMEEREHACDEDVMRMGGEPQVYAESILKVCEFYLASPIACAAGVTGGELKKRIESIMTSGFARKLGYAKKALLAGAAIVTIAVPIAVGLIDAPRGSAQTQSADTAPLEFEAASVKTSQPGSVGPFRIQGMMQGGPGSRDPSLFQCTICTLRPLLLAAYNLRSYQLFGPPSIDDDKYDISAKVQPGATREQFSLMLQDLLVTRFGLATHKETRDLPIYELVVAKGGSKLKEPEKPPASQPQPALPERPSDGHKMAFATDKDGNAELPPGAPAMVLFGLNPGARVAGVSARMMTVDSLLRALQGRIDRPVVDKTGLTGTYDFKLLYAPEQAQMVGVGPPSAPEPPSGQAGLLDAASDPGPNLMAAFEHQLGLKFEDRKGPVQVLVVDKVNRTPTEN